MADEPVAAQVAAPAPAPAAPAAPAPAAVTPPVPAAAPVPPGDGAAPAVISRETSEARPEAKAPAAAPEAVPAEKLATSILGDAKADGAQDAPAEAKAEIPATDAARPTYEAFKTPDGITLDEARVGEFSGILGEFEAKISANPAEAHTAAQELGQKLVDLYVNETRDVAQRFARLQHDNWQRVIGDQVAKVKSDAEIGRNRYDTSLARGAQMIDLYGKQYGAEAAQQLRDDLALTGAGNFHSVLKFVHWASAFAGVENATAVPATGAAPLRGGTRAQRLYPTLNGNGAA